MPANNVIAPGSMTEHIQFQQVSEIPGLVLSTARFARFSFDRHFHLDFHQLVASFWVLSH